MNRFSTISLFAIAGLLSSSLPSTEAHSWLVTPRSNTPGRLCRVDRPGRTINDFGRIIPGTENCPGPCETANAPFNDRTPHVYARGQSVNTAWTRNGHGDGGFSRWSLVNFDTQNVTSKLAFDAGAFKYECFVARTAPCDKSDEYVSCGTDPGSNFQSSLTIPNVFPDGRYRMQWVWFGGVDGSVNGNFGDYYGCADVIIRGGAPLATTFPGPTMPTCNSITSRVGECAQEPCRTGEAGTMKTPAERGLVIQPPSNGGGGNGNGDGDVVVVIPSPSTRPPTTQPSASPKAAVDRGAATGSPSSATTVSVAMQPGALLALFGVAAGAVQMLQ